MVKSTRTIEANNSNAQFSTGPIDTSSSRLNALAHGILSKEVVIVHGSGQENTDEFEELKSAMTTTIAPIGALEELLVDQLVTLSWRWRRVIKYETAAIRSKSHKAIERRLSHQDLFNNPQNLTDEAELLEALLKTLEEEFPPLHQPEVWFKAFQASEEIGVSIEDILGLDDPWDEYDDFSQSQVQCVLDNACESRGITMRELWDAVKESALLRHKTVTAMLDGLNEIQETEKLMASLPDDQNINKIQRYEAHISRQFYKALHELQRLQAARLSGRVQVPLAVDIDVSVPE